MNTYPELGSAGERLKDVSNYKTIDKTSLFKKLLQIKPGDRCKMEDATYSHAQASEHLNQAILDIEEILTLDFNLYPGIVYALREGVEPRNPYSKNLSN